MFVTRGMSIVVTGYDSPGLTLERFLKWLLPGAGDQVGGESETTEGRSWSRVGENELNGARFRVASSYGTARR
jgi:hypothetical protein